MQMEQQQYELPYLEDIYDMETDELERVLSKINMDMQKGEAHCALPVGIESFEKYQRKAAKLVDSLELELEERSQVDNVLNFFEEATSKDYLDDDAFYRLDPKSAGGTTASAHSGQPLPQDVFQITQPKNGGLAEVLSNKNLHSMQMTPVRTDQQVGFQNATVGARNSKQLLNDIDPQRLMDDQQSVYSTSQQSHVAPSQQLDTDQKEKDEATTGGFMRKPMSKKELQAFMKAKLAKTKVQDQATTQGAATGQVQKNFTMKGRKQEPTQRKDLAGKPPAPRRTGPAATPSTYKGKGNMQESDDDDSEDDIAAANERMRQAGTKFQIASNSGNVKKNAKRSSSKGFAEHSSATRSTAKNIYKPCFNMPAKEPKAARQDSSKGAKPNPRAVAKAYAEEQRSKQRLGSQQRNRSKARVEETASQTGTKVFSKPKISSSKGSRASNQTTAAPSQLSQTSQATNSGKPPLMANQSTTSFVLDAPSSNQLESETNEVDQKHSDKDDKTNLSGNEEIESRYSDDNEQSKLSQVQQNSGPAASTQAQVVESRVLNNEGETHGETGTTDLNSNNSESPNDQSAAGTTNAPDISSHIAQQNEEMSDFIQLEAQIQSSVDKTLKPTTNGIEEDQNVQELAQQTDKAGLNNELTEQLQAENGEFTLGPAGFQQVNDVRQTNKHKLKDEAIEVEEDDFYSASAMTNEKSKILAEMLDPIAEDNASNKQDEQDEDYTRARERIEEIKRNELEDKDGVDQFDTAGANDSSPIVIDIEAELKAIEGGEGASSGKDATLAKVELDSRLKVAAEEAKAKGKRTVRTFDMLRKAINGDPDQIKKQQKDLEQKAEAEVEAISKAKELEQSAKKAQTDASETPVMQEIIEDNSLKNAKSKTASKAAAADKETPAKKTLAGTAAISTAAKSSAVARKKAAARNDKNNPFEKASRGLILADESVDYSHIYRNFYDIFVGCFTDTKGFDVSFALRETRNVYASFVNLMASDLLLSNKHKFDKHPLELGYNDPSHSQQAPNHLGMMGHKLNELEMMIQNRDSDTSIKEQQKALMIAAMTQSKLRDKYKQMKNKGQDEINRDAQMLTEAAQSAEAGELGVAEDSKEQPAQERPSMLFFRVVKQKAEVYDIITRSFSRKNQWNELPHGLDLRNCWNLMWVWSKLQKDMTRLLVWQRANHFIGAKNVSRKDFLKRNIERAMKFSGRARSCFDIMPLTYILPKEYVAFLETFSDLEDKEGKMNYWIMKPAAKSRGRGISVVNDIAQVTYGEPMVMQRYLKNPLLLNGYKFDLRIYVLVTSVNPLEMFIYKEGFGRFSTVPYTLDPNDKGNKYVHLTNVSINKYNIKNYDCQQQDRIYGGTKVSLATLKKTFVNDLGIDWDNVVWTQIRQVCVKAMVSAQNDIPFNPNCFDLYGFDVILDEDLKCWLLEINASPALSCDTLLDDMIKQRLIDDTIDLVDPIDFDRKRLFEVLERRSQEEHGGGKTAGNAHQKRSMNKDLSYILHGKVPRAYGEMPRMMGNYERAAPTEQSESYMKLIGGQKMFGSQMKVSEKIAPEKRDKVRGPGSLPTISDKQSEQNKAPGQKNIVGGVISSVTARKQQAHHHQINLAEISHVSAHRPMVQK